MATGNHVSVDQFVIEMSLQETVLKGLQQLERKIVPIANRMEKTLNRTFSKDYSKGMNRTFSNIERRAQQTGRNINRSLTQAFSIGSHGSGLFNTYEREGRAATQRVSQWMRDAYRVPRDNMPSAPAGTHRPAGQPRLTTRQRIDTLAERARTSALYGRLQLRGDGSAQRYNSRLQFLQMEHNASQSLEGFQVNLRRLNFEASQQLRVNSQQRASTRLAAMESTGALSSLASRAIPLVAAFASLQQAMAFFEESIQKGIERDNANRMFNSAFGHGDSSQTAPSTLKARLQVFDIANELGLDKTEQMSAYARFRASAPDSISDDDIIHLQRNQAYFARKTGVGQDAVDRANTQFLQDVSIGKVTYQNLKLLEENIPALAKQLQKVTGVTGAKNLADYYQSHGGIHQFLKDQIKATELTAKEIRELRDSISSERGRAESAVSDAQVSLFSGASSGLMHLYKSIQLLADRGLANKAGQVIGFFIDHFASVIDKIGEYAIKLDGWLGYFSEQWDQFYKTLSPQTQQFLDTLKGAFDSFFTGAIAASLAALTAGLAKLSVNALGIGGAGLAGGIGTFAGKAFGVAAAAEIGVSLGNLIFDQWIPAFHKMLGLDPEKTTHGGNVIENSPLDRVLNWLHDNAVAATSSMPTSNYPPLLQTPSMSISPVQKPITFAPLKIEVVSNGQLNVTMPDGTMQRVALETYNQQHELQMMSATGLQGSWQGAGNNAGFSPSLLLR